MFFSLMTPKSNLKAYHYKDLHVFHPDETNLNKSLDHFFELYGMRNWTNRGFWLLDLTPFQSAGQSPESVLKEMPNLDLDDDFFVFANNGKHHSVVVLATGSRLTSFSRMTSRGIRSMCSVENEGYRLHATA